MTETLTRLEATDETFQAMCDQAYDILNAYALEGTVTPVELVGDGLYAATVTPGGYTVEVLVRAAKRGECVRCLADLTFLERMASPQMCGACRRMR